MSYWIAGGTVAGAALNYFGSQGQASAARDAASQEAAAARNAADLQYKMYQQNFNAMEPWRAAGQGALGQLSALTGPGGGLMQPFQFDPNQDPSYQWRLGQGAEAVEGSAAARGGYFSGQTGLDLNAEAQGMASQEYQNAFQRDQSGKLNVYNMLAGLSNTGQAATQQTGTMGMNAATNIGNYGVQGATALGQGQIGAANAYAGMYQNFNNQIMGGIGAYQNQNLYQQWLDKNSGW